MKCEISIPLEIIINLLYNTYMITTRPDYYDKFKCIADKCQDSCCIGWEIDIDPDTLKIYENESGTLGERLKQNIDNGSFVLTEDERCPFLQKDGLCELICQKGEGFLCEICREHPRYYEYCGDHLDMGIGLCCEEACRLLFTADKPIAFITEGEAELDDEICTLLALRNELADRITDRSCSIDELFFSSEDEIFELWRCFEPYDNRWTTTSGYIREHLSELMTKAEEFNTYMKDSVSASPIFHALTVFLPLRDPQRYIHVHENTVSVGSVHILYRRIL